MASELLQHGARVALTARRPIPLEDIAGHYPQARALPMDATDPLAWQSAHELLLEDWGAIDLVVFCAAQYRQERSWELRAVRVHDTIEVNLASIYYGLEVILPDMITSGAGSVVLIASVAGYMGLPNATVYGPTKAAIINLAELLYAELHPKGLGVYLVNPGFVKTTMTANNSFNMPAIVSADTAASEIIQGIAQGRFEIHFPKRFTRLLKIVSMLPYRSRLAILMRIIGS